MGAKILKNGVNLNIYALNYLFIYLYVLNLGKGQCDKDYSGTKHFFWKNETQ